MTSLWNFEVFTKVLGALQKELILDLIPVDVSPSGLMDFAPHKTKA